jgi:hypothetical protein
MEALHLPSAAPNDLDLPPAWNTSSLLPLFEEGVNDLFSIGGGTYDSADGSGQFTRSGQDSYQGLVASFQPTDLDVDGKFVQAEFLWGGGGTNNSAQQVLMGFFDGPAVDGHDQSVNTDAWTGYFFALGTRLSTDGDTPYGVYWQGPGEIPIFNHVVQDPFPAFSVDGVSHRVTSGLRPPLRNDAPRRVILAIKRLSANQLEFTVTFRTPRSDGSQNSSFSGLGRSVQLTASATNHQGVIRSVWTLPQGTPMRFSAIALAGAESFVLTGLRVETGMPPLLPARIDNMPSATSLPASELNAIGFATAIALPQGSPPEVPQSLHLPTFPSKSLLEI